MGPPRAKKRKRDDNANHTAVDTSKPTAVYTPKEGRGYTVSVALPGSIISNAQSHDLKTTLAGQIARALAVFCVDEVVIFDDGQSKPQRNHHHHAESDSPEQAYTGYSDPDGFLIHILAYLETPPHLRKFLFPIHPNLRTAGTLPSLDMPHHLRAHEWCQYREGVTVETPPVSATTAVPTNGTSTGTPATKKHSKAKTQPTSPTTLIETGLPQKTLLPISIPPNTRVTLKYPSATPPTTVSSTEPLPATAVTPDAPRAEAGYYWGYQIRRASSLAAVFTESTYDDGYDVTIGTSERGVPLSSILDPAFPPFSSPDSSNDGPSPVPKPSLPIPSFRHLLIVFGGVAGLEAAVKADEELVRMGVVEPEGLFDYWVDLCPGQGSRTIRTEEAVWVGLMGLRGVVVGNGRR